MTEPAPRVSILVPNFNNGRESSRSGRRDFIGDLFESLRVTLEDDPAPLEILVADDGSTDDSLATCRAWAARTWRGGRPFCRLDEHPHGGVLSVVANRLTAAARGAICCRLDGDIVIRTPGWATKLLETFEAGPPDLGVVGPMQLAVNGRVHSAGDWVLHPRGYHHVGQGAAPEAIRHAREVDHVMGCFYCHRRVVWEQLGGYDESILRGQTVDFGLRARLRGWRAVAVPHIEFEHAHAERVARTTTADTQDGIRDTLDRFAEKWGFDRLAPDLDVVRARYAGTPLLWNAAVFGPTAPPPGPAGSADIRESDWARYAADAGFRRTIDARVAAAETLRARIGGAGPVLQVGSGTGLVAHLLAKRGFEMIGVEGDRDAVALAASVCGRETYPGPRPGFRPQPESSRLPVEDGFVRAVLLFDVLETHPNPVGLLREARRVLRDGGTVAIATRERVDPLEPDGIAPAYRLHELVLQVQASRCFRPLQPGRLAEDPGTLLLFGARLREDPLRFPGRVEAKSAAPASMAVAG